MSEQFLKNVFPRIQVFPNDEVFHIGKFGKITKHVLYPVIQGDKTYCFSFIKFVAIPLCNWHW